MINKYIDRILLVAILIVGLIGLFVSKSGNVGIAYDSTSVTDANAKITGTLTVDGATTLTGATTIGGATVSISSGTLADATTTILAVVNPFSATSTVDMVRLTNTGVATSTYTVACGKSATAYANTDYDVLSSGSIATSTNFGVIENNITGSYGAAITGGSIEKILVGSGQYLVCKVTTSYPGAFTESTNTFAGTYQVRWTK